MRLREVLNKIFRKRKQKDLVNRHLTDDIYEVDKASLAGRKKKKKITDKITAEQQAEEELLREEARKKKLYVLVGAVTIALAVIIALLGVIYTRVKNSAFSEDRVQVFISGPTKIGVGDSVNYQVTVKNNNRVALQKGILSLNFPSNFKLRNDSVISQNSLTGPKIIIGEIPKYQEKSYKLHFDIGYSSANQQAIRAEFRYRPENISSEFVSQAEKVVELSKSNLGVLITLPSTVSNGEIVKVKFKVKNENSQPKNNLALKIEYPEAFSFSKEENKDAIDNSQLSADGREWQIKSLPAGGEKELQIVGQIVNSTETVGKIKVTLLNKDNPRQIFFIGEKSFGITPPKLLIRQETEQRVVNPGDLIEYKITFKNNSSVVLKNLVLKTHLPAKYIVPSEIHSQGGYFDREKNMLIWKAGDSKQLASLEPGESGQLKFKLRVQRPILFNKGENKNPSLSIFSEMESLDIDSPFYENKKIISKKLVTLINSVVNFRVQAKILPEDNNGQKIDRLKVGQEVNVRLVLQLFNTTNDLKEVKLTADFPASISWVRQLEPNSDNLSFNEQSNSLDWLLGVVRAGTGYDGQAPSQAEFIIKTTPSDNQAGQELLLMNNIKVSGLDTFTKQPIQFNLERVTSRSIQNLTNGEVAPAEE